MSLTMTVTNPTSMVERVAEAMKTRSKQPLGQLSNFERTECTSLGDAWLVLARAAILALREPTDQMIDAPGDVRVGSGEYTMTHGEAKVAWRAMVDAILTEDAGK